MKTEHGFTTVTSQGGYHIENNGCKGDHQKGNKRAPESSFVTVAQINFHP